MRGALVVIGALAIASCGELLSSSGDDDIPQAPSPAPSTDGAADVTQVSVEADGSVDGGDAPDAPDASDSGQKGLRVFVTATKFSGSSFKSFGDDARCQQAADAAGLGGQWRAWLSHSNRQAASVILGDGPWKTLVGDVVAKDRGELFGGTLAHAIDRTETGFDIVGFAWTGTSATGTTLPNHCSEWNSTTGVQGTFGSVSAKDATWTAFAEGGCANMFSLYCFEQP